MRNMSKCPITAYRRETEAIGKSGCGITPRRGNLALARATAYRATAKSQDSFVSPKVRSRVLSTTDQGKAALGGMTICG